MATERTETGIESVREPYHGLLDGLRELVGLSSRLVRQDSPRAFLEESLLLLGQITGGKRVFLVVAPDVIGALGGEEQVSDGRLALGGGVHLVSRGPEADEVRDWEGSEVPVVSIEGARMVVPGSSGGALVTEPCWAAAPDPERVLFLKVLCDLSVAVASHAAQLFDARRRSSELEVTRSRLREQNILLRELAVVDELTGLYNRRFFESRLQYELDRLRRYDCSLALLLFDIDRFKKVNDEHGHLVGDEVLQGVARIARSLVRGVDLIARFGGEEFAVVMPDTCRKGALAGAERLRKKVEASRYHVRQQVVQVTISIGVAAVTSGWVGDSEQLVRAADEALYRAKAAGRNRVVLARRG